MRKPALWIIGVIGGLALAAVLVVIFFQWSWLRGPIEARLSALAGKQVRIEGPITGSKAWVPHIVFNQVRIEAPGFPAQPTIGSIDRVELEIDLRQLLHGKLDFPLIDISKPSFVLLRNSDGRVNWSPDQARGPSDRSRMPLIGTIRIQDGKVTYRDVAKHLTVDATLDTAAANGGSGQGNLTLEGHGTYRRAPFTITLTGGSLTDLRETKHPYDIDAAASIGNTRVKITGTVLDPFKLTNVNLALIADGDNAGNLYPIFGIPAPATPPYHLAGMLGRDGKAWLFKNFSGTVGASDLAGTLRLEAGQKERLFVSGKLTSATLDFADLGLLVGAPGSTSSNRSASDTQRALARHYESTGRVLPDVPLDLDEVRTIDADIAFRGEHVKSQILPLDDVDLHLKLSNGVMSLEPLDVGVAGGRIESNVVIDARQDAVSTDYDVRFRRFQIDQFFKKAGAGQGASGTIDGRIRLHGTGNSVHASLASSDGEVSAIVEQGRISAFLSSILGLDVAKALGLYLTGDKQIAMRCMVADLTVRNGVMTPRAFVLDTEDALITGSGTIDLGDERLDLNISGKSKSPSLTLGGPITVGGTFRSPDVGLGAEAIARGSAAVALGALLTPLAAVVGFIGTGSGQDADCTALVKEANTDASVTPPGTKHLPAPNAAKPARKAR